MPTFLQTASAVGGFLDRAAVHCAKASADPDDIVAARLCEDMALLDFHAVTTYDVLRTQGVPLGMRDYKGRLRTRPADD